MTEWDETGHDPESEVEFGNADTDAAQWDLGEAADAASDAAWYESSAADHLDDAAW
jgi:hypothetical protein